MSTTIKIKSLSSREFDKAIKKVEKYKADLNNKIALLIQALTDRGVKIAKVNVVELGAFDTGVLESSISGYYSPLLGVGIIKADCYYAVYVEMGTGFSGSEAQHPKAVELGYSYDINGHGEDGWFFYNSETGKSGWTTGMPSRPFMYDMTMELHKECQKLAKKYLKS